MNIIVEKIRNKQLELDELQSRKDEIKKKALAHRSEYGVDEGIEEIKAINEKIAETEKEMKELQNEQNEQNIGERNKMLNFEKMERSEMLGVNEYRSAFLKKLQGSTLNDDEKRAMTSAAASGGAAIPTQTMNMILGQVNESLNALGLVSIYNIPQLTSFPKENLTNDAAWVAEGADGSYVSDTLTSISLSAYKLIRLIKITAKLKLMSIDAFEQWIVDTLVKKMKAGMDNAIFNGTGANQPTGFAKSTWDDTNSVTDVISFDSLNDVEALVHEDYIGSAVWVMNRKTLASVKKLKDENKRPLFERAVEDGFRGMILGIPVALDKNVADGEVFIGDWKAAYIYNFTQGVEIMISEEAGFMSGDTAYRAMAHVDGKPTGVAGAMAKLVAPTAE